MPTVSVNLLAVLVAGIANMVVGSLWYSPAFFGKTWMALSGIKKEQMTEAKKKGMAKYYAAAFLVGLVMIYILGGFLAIFQVANVMDALQITFWLWLGFIATVSISSVLWEGKPWTLYFINIGHYLVSLGIASVILTVWQ